MSQKNQTVISHDHTISLLSVQQGENHPAYNFIIFRNQEGKDAMTFHGMSLPRKDGTMTLRAIMDQPAQSQLKLGVMRKLKEVELFRGRGIEYLEKMASAVEASKHINAQNITCDLNNLDKNAPNAVACSLARAMKLEVPEGAMDGLNAPAHDQNLLPKEWRA